MRLNPLSSTVAVFVLVASISVSAQTLAPTPPMGWNSWNHFGKQVTETDVRVAADALVSSGMKDAGYVYVNIDGSWEGKRDANGVLHVDPRKFKDMKALGKYIHSKGLKFGIYSSPGPFTCGGFNASYGHEEQDAKMFAAWGADFLKYDLCSFFPIMKEQSQGDKRKERAIMQAAYEKMHHALLDTRRPIVYSLCQYGVDYVWEWGPKVGAQMWRTTSDIQDNYLSMTSNGFSQAGLSKYAGPGHWNDPDMLEIGNGGMNTQEERTQMSLWAIIAAPLLAGNDLTKMDESTRDILLNKEVIAVDQDPLGNAGDRIWAKGPLEMWSRPLQNDAVAVGLFNRVGVSTEMTLKLADIKWTGPAKVRDLWKRKNIGVIDKEYTVEVPAHGVVMLRLSR